MGPVPQKVLNWLHHVLNAEYQDVNRTYNDVAHTISQHPNLSLKTDIYTYEYGQSSLLVNIAGTLPSNFRGVTYLFPVSIWVPHGYPRAVPVVFVTPTPTMSVRPGQYVSGEGRIYHPYLAAWREDRSNIVEFLSILQQVFAREPPVISRADPPPNQQIPHPGQPSNMEREPPPIPPLPPELEAPSSGMQGSLAISDSEIRPPKLPPKPFLSDGQNIRLSGTGLPTVPRPLSFEEQRFTSPQNVPQRPYTRPMPPVPQNSLAATRSLQAEQLRTPPKHPVTPVYPPQQRRESYSPVSPLSPERQPTDLPVVPTQGPQSSYTQHQSPRQAPFENLRQPSASHQWDPSQRPLRQGAIPFSQPYPDPRNDTDGFTMRFPKGVNIDLKAGAAEGRTIRLRQGDGDEEGMELSIGGSRYPQSGTYSAPRPKAQPPGDLLTSPFETPIPGPSVHVTPPPIPPNPQKDALLSALSQTLTQKIQASHGTNMAAISPLHAQQTALHSALTSMNREISQLNELQSLLTSNEAILHQAMRDADKVMEDAKHRKVPSVDDVLVAPTVVARQLYELVADETSLEECRGVVGRALDRGRIGGDVWAKQTRSIAREEFLRKALIRKIAQGMGLTRDERWE